MSSTRSELLAWLSTAEGANALVQAAALPPDSLVRLTRLRKTFSPEQAAALVEQWELRRRARAKFPNADRMLFTPEGLEQSTGAALAAYRAARFPQDGTVLDVCCGLGSDADALAQRGSVVAVDLNPAVAVCARYNTAAAPYPVRVLCADAMHLDLNTLHRAGVRSFFFDPSRRRTDAHGERRRAVRPEDYSPPLDFVEVLGRAFPDGGAKVSPALPDDTLLAHADAVEFVSEGGECKEAILWRGACAAHLPSRAFSATVLRVDYPPATLSPKSGSQETSPPLTWLYDPDPAVSCAGLIAEAAALVGGARLFTGGYLTSERFVKTPFAAPYRVLESLPYHPKHVQKVLRERGARLAAVKKRGTTPLPEQVRKDLKDVGDIPVVLVLTRNGDSVTAVLCAEPEPDRRSGGS